MNKLILLIALAFLSFYQWRRSIANIGSEAASRGARSGLGGQNPRMSLSRHCETYWSRIRRWIVRNFHILSEVKICIKCLQTGSPFAGLRPSVLRPWTLLGGTPRTIAPNVKSWYRYWNPNVQRFYFGFSLLACSKWTVRSTMLWNGISNWCKTHYLWVPAPSTLLCPGAYNAAERLCRQGNIPDISTL